MERPILDANDFRYPWQRQQPWRRHPLPPSAVIVTNDLSLQASKDKLVACGSFSLEERAFSGLEFNVPRGS
jgi:hypothetical protein